MSINYALYLGADRSPQEVLDKVGRCLGLELHARQGRGSLMTNAIGGLNVSAHPVCAPDDRYIKEEHGFIPKVRVSMRLDKEDLRTAEDGVVDLLTVFAHQCGSDAVLLREDDGLAYRRRDGFTEVGESDPLWADPKRRKKLNKRKREFSVGGS